MNSDEIQKYKKRSVPWLRKKAQELCNEWIRKRDEGQKCVSCSSYNTTDASHFYSRGSYPALALEETNIHKSCPKCNRFQGGNIHEYRIGIVTRIGVDGLEKLDNLAAYWKRNTWKPDRLYYIEKILYFQSKLK